MANRHLARSIVLQTLFEWDFMGQKNDTAPDKLAHNVKEFAPGIEDATFSEKLLDLVLKKQTVIDDILQKAAPEWPLEKTSVVDRNILRIGLAELLFGDRDEVPPKVAINEAIELAKTFGGDTSSKFVNGVLGTVYKEIGEPEKDQKTKKKTETDNVDPKTLPIEKKVGAVIYTIKDGEPILAFVHDVFGYWTLSKGSVEEGENEKEACKRVLKEELSIDVEIEDKLGENEYIASHPEKGKRRKQVTYFLAKAKDDKDPVLPKDKGGLDDARWFSLDEISQLSLYDDVVVLVTKTVEKLVK